MSRSWVSGRSFCVPCVNIAIAVPTRSSTNITNYLVLVAEENCVAAAGRSMESETIGEPARCGTCIFENSVSFLR